MQEELKNVPGAKENAPDHSVTKESVPAPPGTEEVKKDPDGRESMADGKQPQDQSMPKQSQPEDQTEPEHEDAQEAETEPEHVDLKEVKTEPEHADTQEAEAESEHVDTQEAEAEPEHADAKEAEADQEQADTRDGRAETDQEQGVGAVEQKVAGDAADTKKAAVPFGTGIDEDVSQEEQPKKKRKLWKRVLLVFAVLLLLAAGAAYGGGIYYFQDKFLPNTTINGFEASYASVEEIKQQIDTKVREYKLYVGYRGDKTELLTSDQIGYHYAPKGEVEGFKESQNLYLWPLSFWDTFDYTFESGAAFDEEKFTAAINGLKCVQPENMVQPEDAYMKFDPEDHDYVIVPEVEGALLDMDKVMLTVKEAVEKGKDFVSLEKEGCYVNPAVTSSDKTLNRLVKQLNKFCHTRIEYVFGENREVLDGSVISGWVSYDDKGNVTLDEEQIPVFVAGLAEKYDTYNKPREFKTNDGSYVTVSGGQYGWMIDQEAEIEELKSLIYSGARTERYAAFAQTAVSWENSDLGWDYVEIDLTRQHLWLYIGGEVAVESDFVSGDMRSGEKATPPGTYTLYYKKSPDVLKSDKPGDSYETPVTFWMPFNGGVGMHDAVWRGSFGGNIYTYDGSHGCINLPYNAASQIYDLVYEGFPIICFYR